MSFRNDLDSYTLLSLENDPLAFCIIASTSLLVPPFSATILPKQQKSDDLSSIQASTVSSKGISFYLIIVAGHFPLAHLTFKIFMRSEQCVC